MPLQVRPVVGIHRDRYNWHKRYGHYCHEYGLEFIEMDLFSNDWITAAKKCDVVLFKGTMNRESIRILKERIYYLETFLGKTSVPNWNSFWHFDSKAIQREVAQLSGMKIPDTIVAGTSCDIELIKTVLPDEVIIKESFGAGSSYVKSIRNDCLRRWRLRQWQLERPFYRVVCACLRRIGIQPLRGPQKVIQRMIDNDGFDIRIVTIGERYAYFFKRLVRDNDFRASGSGRIDYSWDERYSSLLRRLLGFSRRMKFNTMAYDIIIGSDACPYLIEMSSLFGGKAMPDCPNVFRVSSDLEVLERILPIDPLELQVRMLTEP